MVSMSVTRWRTKTPPALRLVDPRAAERIEQDGAARHHQVLRASREGHADAHPLAGTQAGIGVGQTIEEIHARGGEVGGGGRRNRGRGAATGAGGRAEGDDFHRRAAIDRVEVAGKHRDAQPDGVEADDVEERRTGRDGLPGVRVERPEHTGAG